MTRKISDGTPYETGTRFPTFQDMAEMAERHAEKIANWHPECEACEATKHGGMIHIDLHTCQYAEKHKALTKTDKTTGV